MHTVSGILERPIAASPRLHSGSTIVRHVRSSTIGWIAMTVMILSGSTSTAFGKELTTYFSPLSMLFVSEVMLLLFAVLSFGLLPIVKNLKRIPKETVLPLLTASVLNGVLAPVFWFTGLEQTFAINSQLFGNAETIFLILFGILLIRQIPRRAQWFGGGIILSGLLLVALRGFSEQLSFERGDVLIIFAGSIYGLGAAIIGKYLRHVAPQVIIVGRSLCAIAFFFLLSPFINHPFITELQAFPWAMLSVLLGYGLISRFLLIFSYYESIERLPLPTVSLLGTVSVGTSMLFAHLYLGEVIAWYQACGALLIIMGAIVVQWGSLQKVEENLMHYLKSHHRH